MAVYTYILKNQYACENCAKEMGREKDNKDLKPEFRKCGLCGQKKEVYHARDYKDSK
ncbi:hypothetical protein [Aliarcobacter butzleri]|uniref:hypothetical protein n=1 Tax=Aliarcobacter butzleri TaxID=28197 RepID=UPI0024DDFF3F|nr:hypothetical protein [Aliarcobacter butzleri]MDK2050550.1 hypothetical protein [Aliarcobacter butzleri]